MLPITEGTFYFTSYSVKHLLHNSLRTLPLFKVEKNKDLRNSSKSSAQSQTSLKRKISNLFGSHAINNGVESRRNYNVTISQEDVDITWNIVAKSVSHKGEKGWSEES